MPDWLPNAISLAGIVALFLPALAANRVAYRLSRLRCRGAHPLSGPRFAVLRLRAILRYLTGWTLLDTVLLWTGYVALIVGTSLGFFV